MHIARGTARALDAHALARRQTDEVAALQLGHAHGYEQRRIGAFRINPTCIQILLLGNDVALAGNRRRIGQAHLPNALAFAQLVARVQEAVVGRYNHARRRNVRANALGQRAQLFNRIGAGIEHVLLGGQLFARAVYLVVVQVHQPRFLQQGFALGTGKLQVLLRAKRPRTGLRLFQHCLALNGRNGGQSVCQHLAGTPIKLQPALGQQGRHAELGNRGEHRLHAAQLHLGAALGIQALPHLAPHLVAQGVGDYDHRALGHVAEFGQRIPEELALLGNPFNVAAFRPLALRGAHPAIVHLRKVPVRVQRFCPGHSLAGRFLKRFHVGFLAGGISHAQAPIGGIHLPPAALVFAPHLGWLRQMEARGVLLVEAFHGNRGIQQVEIACHPPVPGKVVPGSNSSARFLAAVRAAGNRQKQLGKYGLVYAGEHIATHQRFQRKLAEALPQAAGVFYQARNLEQVGRNVFARGTVPILHYLHAERRIVVGYARLQPGKRAFRHGKGSRGNEDVRCQVHQGIAPIHFARIARAALHQGRQRVHHAVLGKLFGNRGITRMQRAKVLAHHKAYANILGRLGPQQHRQNTQLNLLV